MQDRPAATTDRDVRHLNPRKMYEFLASVGTGVSIGSLGLGTVTAIPKNSSLITMLTVEGFTSAMSLVTVVHESIDVGSLMCCRRDNQTVLATNHPPTQYSLYLTYRIVSNIASLVGVALNAYDLSYNEITAKSIVGFALIAVNAFVARQLSTSTEKPAGVVVAGEGEGDIEQGQLMPQPRAAVVAAPHAAMWQQRRAPRTQEWDVPLEKDPEPHDDEAVMVEVQPVAEVSAAADQAPQSNQFFQAQPAAAVPPPAKAPSSDRPRKKGYVAVPRKR